MLAKIHIAKKELGMSDEEYRDMLHGRYKKDSAAKLTRWEAADLMDHFKRAGFRVRIKGIKGDRIKGDMTGIGIKGDTIRNQTADSGHVPLNPDSGHVPLNPVPLNSSSTAAGYERPMARKVVALWVRLAVAGKLRNGSDAALQSFVKRQTGISWLGWCDDGQLWRLIEALKSWAKREGVEIE
jgi:phage gp16-like protein